MPTLSQFLQILTTKITLKPAQALALPIFQGRLDSLREQWARVQQMQVEIDNIERRLASVLRNTPQCQLIAEIPGVG